MDWPTLQKTHDSIAQTAFNIYLQHQAVEPQVMMLRAGVADRLVMVPPKAVAAMYETEQGRHQLSRLIRSLMSPHSATAKAVEQQYGFMPDLVIQIHEAVQCDLDAETGTKVHGTEQNCLLVVMHTAFGSIPVAHPIVKDPYPHVVPGAFPGPEVLDTCRGPFSVQGEDPATGRGDMAHGFSHEESDDSPAASRPCH